MLKQSRGRPRSFDRDVVVNEAMIAFWKHGYDNVSMDSLCELTKLTKPSFYHAFESKERLFFVCLKRYQNEYASPLLDRLLSNPDPMDGYEKMLLAASRRFRDSRMPTGCLVLTGAIEARGKTKAIDKELENMQRLMLKELKNYFSDKIQKNSKISPHAIAQFVLSQLYSLAMFSRTNAYSINFTEFVRTSQQLLKSLLA